MWLRCKGEQAALAQSMTSAAEHMQTSEVVMAQVEHVRKRAVRKDLRQLACANAALSCISQLSIVS